MFEIEKTYRFEAGHVLPYHDGKCSQPHGHSYVMVLRLRDDKLQTEGPKKNMVIDFTDISTMVRPMIEEYLDHKWLNDTLGTDSPTVEYIAKWIYLHLEPQFPSLYAVTVHETATARATYYG